MMGPRQEAQAALFYEFSLEDPGGWTNFNRGFVKAIADRQ